MRRRSPSASFYKLLLFALLVLILPTSVVLTHFSKYSLAVTSDATKSLLLDEANHTDAPPPQMQRWEVVQLTPRRAKSNYGGWRKGNSSEPYAIDSIILCRKGCCIDELRAVVRSLLEQTLIPTRMTVLHGCKDEGHTSELKKTVRTILGGEGSYGMWPEFVERRCQENLPECLLAHLEVETEKKGEGYVFALDSGMVLERTAIESMWLSLNLRSSSVKSIRALRYDEISLFRERERGEALAVRRVVAGKEDVRALPIMITLAGYRESLGQGFRSGAGPWSPFIDILSNGRFLRMALYTDVGAEGEVMSLNFVDKQDLPQHLYSELASQKWAAQLDENEIYKDKMLQWSERKEPLLDIEPIPFQPVTGRQTRVFLVLPWMQLGGSEKCMLDIAERVLEMGWSVSFILTMPFWQENEIGEIGLYHQWLDKALALSSDTFDLLSLGSHEKSIKAFRHFLTSRQPDYLLMANTRWAYANSALIRKLSPKTIIADYNHMIHMSWEGGGMPRYGANNSESFDLHLTASEDVASAMRGWIRKDVMEASPEKVQPCYIGTDPNLLHTGLEKNKSRARMREALNVSDSQTVVLFAGRFVIDKGLDVMSDLVDKVAEVESMAQSLTFVFVGSGDEEYRLNKLVEKAQKRTGPRVLIRPPARGLLELREYYALSDILMLPSVNEGIALVIYEAMATGVLVITTDVGGQKEVVTEKTGILLPNFRSLSRMTTHTFEKLKEVMDNPEAFATLARNGEELVRSKYTTEKFCTCVVQNLLRVKDARDSGELDSDGKDKALVALEAEDAAQDATGNVQTEGHAARAEDTIEGGGEDEDAEEDEEGEFFDDIDEATLDDVDTGSNNNELDEAKLDAEEESQERVNGTAAEYPEQSNGTTAGVTPTESQEEGNNTSVNVTLTNTDGDTERVDERAIGNLEDNQESLAPVEIDEDMRKDLISGAQTERYHGVWNMKAASRSVESMVTIGIKTYVCDPSIVEQVRGLIRSIRVHYPRVRVLLGNDGPWRLASEEFVKNDTFTEELDLPKDCGISYGRNHMVNQTHTRYFLLLDDDHVFDDTTNLTVLVDGIDKDGFDMVGMRVRNLPGIDELERTGIVIPRYVAMIQKLEERILTLCVWNENKGPSIFGITHPIPVDVLHNAFIGRTAVLRKHPWRNVLKVNEHMTFFLDAKWAGVKVGYLPSVWVHHRSRDYSDCYYQVRFREDKYRKLLPYKDEFAWDMKCQAKFPERIRSHILKYELDI